MAEQVISYHSFYNDWDQDFYISTYHPAIHSLSSVPSKFPFTSSLSPLFSQLFIPLCVTIVSFIFLPPLYMLSSSLFSLLHSFLLVFIPLSVSILSSPPTLPLFLLSVFFIPLLALFLTTFTILTLSPFAFSYPICCSHLFSPLFIFLLFILLFLFTIL